MDNKQIPNKLFFKIGEVCEITDTQPYVLRYWESEFPALAPAKNSSGQRIYRRKRHRDRAAHQAAPLRGGLHDRGREEAPRGRDGRARRRRRPHGAACRETVAPTVEPAPRAPSRRATTTRAVLLEVREQLREMLTLLDKGDRKSQLTSSGCSAAW